MNTFSAYLAVGLCALPAIVAEKRPAVGSWKSYQSRLPTEDEAVDWGAAFNGDGGYCLICGDVSDGLEMIDFDLKSELFPAWYALVGAENPDILDRILIETSQSGGMHVVYRYQTDDTRDGNMKLAQREYLFDTDEPAEINGKTFTPRRRGDKWAAIVTLIETRGQGGLFLCAPSKGYEIQQGSFTDLPVFTTAERQTLIDAAASLNEYFPPPEPEPKKISTSAASGGSPYTDTYGRPGDDFNRRGDVREVLKRAGWSIVKPGDNEYWRRPGKKTGWSATLKDGVFYVWSSNAPPFEPEKGYSPFSVYAILTCGGDFSAAARILKKEGYGGKTDIERRNSLPISTPEPPATTILEQQSSLLSDVGNASRLAKRCLGRFLFCPDLDRWLVYDGKRWDRDGTLRINAEAERTVMAIAAEANYRGDDAKAIYKWAGISQARSRIASMIELAKPHMAASINTFDLNPWILNLQNGTLDLKTFTLRPADPADYITRVCRANYNPDADAPIFDAFLKRIFQTTPALIPYLMKALGYTLTGVTTEQALFFAHGNGQNGKSKLFEGVSYAMGDYAIKADRTLLVASRNDKHPAAQADLKGARLALVSETEDGNRIDESLLKDLTGEKTVKAREYFGQFFEFIMEAKLWMYSNHKPTVRGTDEGIWRRIKAIPFVETISTEEKDPEMGSKLCSEADGIMARIVAGCEAWQIDGLGFPEEVAKSTNEYRVSMDSVGSFISDCCIKSDPSKYTECLELYKAYRKWADENGEYTKTAKAFSLQLYERKFIKGFHPYTRRAVFLGIQLLEPELYNQ